MRFKAKNVQTSTVAGLRLGPHYRPLKALTALLTSLAGFKEKNPENDIIWGRKEKQTKMERGKL